MESFSGTPRHPSDNTPYGDESSIPADNSLAPQASNNKSANLRITEPDMSNDVMHDAEPYLPQQKSATDNLPTDDMSTSFDYSSNKNASEGAGGHDDDDDDDGAGEFEEEINDDDETGKRSRHQTPSQDRRITATKLHSGFTPRTMEFKGVCRSQYQCNQALAYYAIKDENEEPEDMKSSIYVTSRTGANFSLGFTAENVTIEPLFISPRKYIPHKNEKMSQIKSKEKIYEDNTAAEYINLKRARYSLDDTKVPEKPLLPPIQVYSTSQLGPQRDKDHISRPTRSPTTGFIFLQIDECIMKVRVEPLPITKIRMPITNDVRSTMERLRMPCSDEFKNRAQLLVRFRNDILRVRFDLADCEVSKLPERKSLAVQTDTRMVIRQQFSPFTRKMVNLQIPESTYIYRDPMPDIRRLNHHFTTLQISPLWKYEIFQKRISELRANNSMEADIAKVIKRSRGSVIVFEGFDAIATASGGLLCARVMKGRGSYEDKIHYFLGDTVRNDADEDGEDIADDQEDVEVERGFKETNSAEIDEPKQAEAENLNMSSSIIQSQLVS